MEIVLSIITIVIGGVILFLSLTRNSVEINKEEVRVNKEDENLRKLLYEILLEKKKIRKILLKQHKEKEVEKIIIKENNNIKNDVVAALITLGYKKSFFYKTLTKIMDENPTLSVKEIIKEILGNLPRK